MSQLAKEKKNISIQNIATTGHNTDNVIDVD